MKKMPTSPIGKRGFAKPGYAQRGFTLIELVVVIVLIAVLAGMALPRLSGALGTAQLRTSARDLLVAARQARTQAVMRHQRWRLVIAPEEGQFYLEHEPQPRERPGQFEPYQRHLLRRSKLGAGIAFSMVKTDSPLARDRGAMTGGVTDQDENEGGRTARITFEPNGTADSAIIQITGDQRTWTLRIAPSTGRAQLAPTREDQWLHDREDLDA